MQIADMMKPEGRIFLKSEWNQIDSGWPCVSFTKRSVGERLRRDYLAGRDVLVYVGTTNQNLTKNAEHRSRLISAVTIEPKHILATRDIVPAEVWASTVAVFGERWPHAMAVVSAANLVGPPYPDAREVIPSAYRSFAEIANRGGIVEAIETERDSVKLLAVERVDLSLGDRVVEHAKLRSTFTQIEKSINQEATRMANLIIERVARGGELNVRINPQRAAPNFSTLFRLLVQKWTEGQSGLCNLCGGKLIAGAKNRMLQPSADRIDSSNGAYDEENVQITHLACNWAKNRYSMDEFEDWLSVVRGVELETDATEAQ